ncbi:hypothetical protein [Nautilia sp.]
MLTNKIQEAINTLESLIKLTKKDIDNIKAAKHEEVFANTQKKEMLAVRFSELKNQIDVILSSRNRPLEEIFTDEEERLFNIFKEKLFVFNKEHKRFSKLALSVANFYNALLNQIKKNETINYKNESFNDSKLHLKA